MNRNELKTGMIVKDRNGNFGVVLTNTLTGDYVRWFRNCDNDTVDYAQSIDELFGDDLLSITDSSDDDIVAVYHPDGYEESYQENILEDENDNYLLWKRIEHKYKVGDEFRFKKIRVSALCDSNESVRTSHDGKAEIISVYNNQRNVFFYTIKTTDGSYYTLTEKMINACAR